MFKKLTLWLVATIFAGSVFAFITILTAVIILRPAHIEQWVSNSGIYGSLPSKLIEQTQKTQKTEPSSDGISFSDPIIQSAAKEALSPEFVQSSSEQIITSTFKWLDGEVAKPDFQIDTAGVKQRFASSIAGAAKERYAQLPACTKNQFPKTTDPLKIDCRPSAGVDIDEQIAAFTRSIVSSKDFLPDATISADSFMQSGTSGTPLSSKSSSIPKTYQWAKLLPVLIGVVMLVCSTGILFLSATKRLGIRKIGSTLSIVSITSFISLFVGSLVITKLREQFARQTDNSSGAVFKDTTLSIAQSLQADLLKIGGIISGIIFIIGVILLIVAYIIKRRQKQSALNLPKEQRINTSEQKLPNTEQGSSPTTGPSPRPIVQPKANPRPPRNLIQ